MNSMDKIALFTKNISKISYFTMTIDLNMQFKKFFIH